MKRRTSEIGDGDDEAVELEVRDADAVAPALRVHGRRMGQSTLYSYNAMQNIV